VAGDAQGELLKLLEFFFGGGVLVEVEQVAE
jgi:hypothetical protein